MQGAQEGSARRRPEITTLDGRRGCPFIPRRQSRGVGSDKHGWLTRSRKHADAGLCQLRSHRCSPKLYTRKSWQAVCRV